MKSHLYVEIDADVSRAKDAVVYRVGESDGDPVQIRIAVGYPKQFAIAALERTIAMIEHNYLAMQQLVLEQEAEARQ